MSSSDKRSHRSYKFIGPPPLPITTAVVNRLGAITCYAKPPLLSTSFADLARALHIKLAETYHTFVQQNATPRLDTTHAEEVCVVSRFPTPSTPGSQATLTTRHSYITYSLSVLTDQEFTTDTIPRKSWSVLTKPNPPIPTITHAPSTNTTPQGHAQLEAPQAPQTPIPATPRRTSWAAVAAESIAALPPTQPETASNTSYTEAQMQDLLASQEQRLKQ
ncbi:hypothetical protein IV203_011569 [Nitzschia inconspicua]|uniref:Uncharacterized protein n=1 Tax=Nitzschia inconspicua TaxID=303405 RepID=A0A9K3PIJ4_9STRA|nr:hypothetical protein IV203_011569 [Nitzschia inconspicua]